MVIVSLFFSYLISGSCLYVIFTFSFASIKKFIFRPTILTTESAPVIYNFNFLFKLFWACFINDNKFVLVYVPTGKLTLESPCVLIRHVISLLNCPNSKKLIFLLIRVDCKAISEFSSIMISSLNCASNIPCNPSGVLPSVFKMINLLLILNIKNIFLFHLIF